MPTVPRYQQLDVPAPSTRANVSQRDATIGGADIARNIGAGLETAAKASNDVAIRLQERENVDMVFRAEATLKDELAKHLREEQDKKGIDAWGSAERTTRWFGENLPRFTEGLSNDNQRRIFGQTVEKMRVTALDSTARHENAQRHESLTESAKATITGSINFAAANYTDGAAIDTAKGDIIRRVGALGQLRGWSAEQREAFAAEQLSTLHTQVLENMLGANPDGARAYYALNQGEILGSKRNTIEKVLNTSTMRARAQGVVDEVTAAGLTEAEGIARIRKEFSGEEEDNAVLALKTRFREQTDARERLQRDAADGAYKIFAQTGRLNAIPAQLWEKLDGKVQIALRKDAKHLAEGTQAKTDPNIYYLLRRLAADDPDKFRGIDLRGYFPQLGRGDRESLIDLQTTAKKPEKQRDLRTLTQQLNNAYRTMGLGSKDTEKKGLFEQRVVEAITDLEAKTGKPVPDEERQKIINRNMTAGEVLTGRWYLPDPNRRFFEVAGTAEQARFAPTVPPAERRLIEQAWEKAHKRKPTDKEVVDLYRRKQGL